MFRFNRSAALSEATSSVKVWRIPFRWHYFTNPVLFCFGLNRADVCNRVFEFLFGRVKNRREWDFAPVRSSVRQDFRRFDCLLFVVVVCCCSTNRPIILRKRASSSFARAQKRREEESDVVVVSRFVVITNLQRHARRRKGLEREKERRRNESHVLNLVCLEIVIVHRFRRSTSPLGRAHGWLSRRGRLVAVHEPRHFSCFVGSKTNTNCSRRRKRLYFCVLCVRRFDWILLLRLKRKKKSFDEIAKDGQSSTTFKKEGDDENVFSRCATRLE